MCRVPHAVCSTALSANYNKTVFPFPTSVFTWPVAIPVSHHGRVVCPTLVTVAPLTVRLCVCSTVLSNNYNKSVVEPILMSESLMALAIDILLLQATE